MKHVPDIKPRFVVPEWFKDLMREHHGEQIDDDETVECLACGTDCLGECDRRYDELDPQSKGEWM